MTIFNESDYRTELLTACQYGVPVKSRLASSYGETPSAMVGMMYLENTILEIPTNWIPLQSSHTAISENGGNVGNAKTSASTETTQKADSNNPQNRVK
jgi:hypothetical protein